MKMIQNLILFVSMGCLTSVIGTDQEPDHYVVLGVARDATETQINKAFQKLARQYHPDRCHNRSPEDKEKYEDLFKCVNQARSVLMIPRSVENTTAHSPGFTIYQWHASGGTQIKSRCHVFTIQLMARNVKWAAKWASIKNKTCL